MRNIKVILTLSLVSLMSCNSVKKTETLQGCRFIYSTPAFTKNEGNSIRIINNVDTVTMIRLNSYIMYVFPKTRELQTGNAIPGTNKYLVVKSGNESGYYFRNKDSSSIQVNVDSLLQIRLPKGEDLTELPPDLFRKVETGQKSSQLGFEKYAVIKAANRGDMDTVYLEFDRSLNDIEFSMSRILDSSRGAKLSLISFSFKEQMDTATKKEFSREEFKFELQRSSKEETQENLAKLKRFLKSIGN